MINFPSSDKPQSIEQLVTFTTGTLRRATLIHMANARITTVCYGEVLWDLFPSGPKPGGAPLNVAYHLKKLGMDSQIISRVGKDPLGEKLLALINQWGIPTRWCQTDNRYPTGTVVPKILDNQDVHYEILAPVAWDFIHWEKAHESLIKNAKAFIFQSLSARNQISRKTLYTMLETAAFKAFDINLRPPYYDPTFIKGLLKKSDLVKMNLEEFKLVLSWVDRSKLDERNGVRYLQDTLQIKEILITKGSKGASYYNENEVLTVSAIPITVNDPVGSGNAFLAGFLSKRLTNETLKTAMDHATALGAFIATQAGACPDYNLKDLENFIVTHPPKPHLL